MQIDNSLYSLTKEDVEKGSIVLRDAFIDYPTFRYLFPKFSERKKKLKHVMSFFLKCGLLQGEVLAPSKNIEGVSIWYKSENVNFGPIGLLKAGLISTIFKLNIKTFIKFKKLGGAKKANRNSLLDKEYYFLDVIGIDPAFKNKGYARSLMDSMLEKIDKERMVCFLETSNTNNIKYHNKYGFNLLSTYNFDGLESYCMIRE